MCKWGEAKMRYPGYNANQHSVLRLHFPKIQGVWGTLSFLVISDLLRLGVEVPARIPFMNKIDTIKIFLYSIVLW